MNRFYADLRSQAFYESRIHAVHINWQLDDVLQMSTNIIEALRNERCHLQELGRNENANRIFYLNGWRLTVHVLHEPVKDSDVAVH